ncbi:MAG TPA: hypothetical protein DDY98_07360 [Ruminococcaceae bacterium]|nr:hypothetical protein [Oscillospiraceae bacterium]
MRHLAVVSCYFINNYGSVLQAFATEQYLQSAGADCQTVSVERLKPFLWKKKKEYYCKNKTDFSLLASKIPQIQLRLSEKINYKGLKTKSEQRIASFDAFRERFCLTECQPASTDELNKLSEQFDTVVLGGDQLWRPDNLYPQFYTLEWVRDGVRKVSLATSFGVRELDGASARHAAEFLPTFSAISVRETNGCDLVKSVCGAAAQVICDPVFLLSASQWAAVADASVCPKEPYVFCYFLGKDRQKAAAVRRYCEKNGLKAVAVGNIDRVSRLPRGAVACNASPEQFLALIQNASAVFTDSFHCMAFSVLFRKRFGVFRRAGNGKKSTDSRLLSFLDNANLREHLIQPGDVVGEEIERHLAFSQDLTELEESIAQAKRFIDRNIFEKENILG